MRSIRLSLTLYFLALLGVALGTVSVLVYRNAEQTLEEKTIAAEEKNASARALITARYEEEGRKERERLDRELFQQARSVAERAVPQRDNARIQKFSRDWERWFTAPNRATHQAVQMLSLGMMPTPTTAPMIGFWSSWAAEGSKQRFAHGLYWVAMASIRPQIRLQNDESPPPVDDQTTEYCQIDSPLGTSYRSDALLAHGIQFPVSPDWLDGQTLPYHLDWHDVRLSDEVIVRRVILVVPFARMLRMNVPPLGRGGWSGGTRSRGPGTGQGPVAPRPGQASPPRSDSVAPQPTLLIQYGFDLSGRERLLAAIAEKRNLEFERLAQELQSVNSENSEAILDLRNDLLLINGFAFLAMIVGTFGMVRLGLTPLKRLSDAVGQVSEKDFRLRLGDSPLPRELLPIAAGLTQTLEQLERAFAREKQATADISHELRTPLAALMTTIEVTLRKQRSAEEYRVALADCQGSAEQIHQAVERLLALARLDAGVDRIRPQTIDAVAVARQCLCVIRPLAEAQGLQLSLDAVEPALLQTDPDKLREILNNLLHNAIQYNRPNGSIGIAVHCENGHLQLQVRDTGIGIKSTARPHIFERFYRADPSRQSDGMHAGLGLAIVKGYLDLMGGTIEVDSIEGQGSTFSISLPA